MKAKPAQLMQAGVQDGSISAEVDAAEEERVALVQGVQLRPPAVDTWHFDDALAREVGRHLTDPKDVANFERALGRPVTGLYASLFDGALHQLLAPEIERLRARSKDVAACADTSAPNWPDRAFVRGTPSLTTFVAQVLHEEPNDLRLFYLERSLKAPAWRKLPLTRQVREEVDRRLLLFTDVGQQLWPTVRALLGGERGAPYTAATLAEVDRHVLGFYRRYRTHLNAWRPTRDSFYLFGNVMDELKSKPLADSGAYRWPLLKVAALNAPEALGALRLAIHRHERPHFPDDEL